MGILIENFAGAFPLWLAPVQVKLLPIADRHIKYGKGIMKKLTKNNLRVELDEVNDKISAKIRKTELEKIPYMLIFGDKEIEEDLVSVRKRGKGDLGRLKIAKFVENVLKEISEKNLI